MILCFNPQRLCSSEPTPGSHIRKVSDYGQRDTSNHWLFLGNLSPEVVMNHGTVVYAK